MRLMGAKLAQQLIPLSEAEVFGLVRPVRGSAMSLAVLGGVNPNQEARFGEILRSGSASSCVENVVDFVGLFNVFADCARKLVGACAPGQISARRAFQGTRDPGKHVPGVGRVRVGSDAESSAQAVFVKVWCVSGEKIASIRQCQADGLAPRGRRVQRGQHRFGDGFSRRMGSDLVKDKLESVRPVFVGPGESRHAAFAGCVPRVGQRLPVFLGAKVSHVLPPMGQISVGGCAAVWSRGVSARGRAYTRLSLAGGSDTKAGVRRDG